MKFELVRDLLRSSPRVEFREAEPDGTDAELAVLRGELDLLGRVVGQLELSQSRLSSELEDAKVPDVPDVDLQARYDRLFVAFHDAIRRPLGVTPASGEEFYDDRAAREAEDRRPGRGSDAQRSEASERTRPLTDRSRGLLLLEGLSSRRGHGEDHGAVLCRRSELEDVLRLLGGPLL